MAEGTDEGGIPAPEGPTDVIQTDYAVGQDNVRDRIGPLKFDVHNPVFMISGLTIVGFVILSLALQDQADIFFATLRDWLTANLDWFFLITGNIFVVLCIALIFSPWAKIRLGGHGATPDFGYAAWFAMLFAAGMGI
ncbi:MAG TPA: BCCT family transporter, partial [Paracoccaceae bacterium]|nr:BCCT family transporter [Paracoccaceae bacterium]